MAEELTGSKTVCSSTLKVGSPMEARVASNTAGKVAQHLGFSVDICGEIALVASELASNIVRHAGSGELTISPLDFEGRSGIQIVAEDLGPGIADIELAFADGYSTSGGLGTGLGTVNRLMDALQVSSGTKGGLRIVCQRWMRPTTRNLTRSNLVVGAATRPFRNSRENGDAFVIRQWDDHALAGIIDGLGHGEFAQRASHAARQYLETHFDQPFEALFQGVGRACRATRGVVMSLARFDLARKHVSVAGIGNIEVRMLGGPRHFTHIMRRGIIGLAGAPKPHTTEHPWTSDCVLIMHSDGVKNRWKWEELGQVAQAIPEQIATGLVRDHGRIDDDATVLVAKNMEPAKLHGKPSGIN